MQAHVAGALRRVGGLDAARDDEKLVASSEIQPAVDVERLRGDVGRRVAGQEHHRIGDFLGRAQALREGWFPPPSARSAAGHAGGRHVGLDQARGDRVRAHAMRRAEARDHLRQRNQPGLARGVMRGARAAVLAADRTDMRRSRRCPVSASSGRKTWAQMKGPFRLAARTSSQSSSVTSIEIGRLVDAGIVDEDRNGPQRAARIARPRPRPRRGR